MKVADFGNALLWMNEFRVCLYTNPGGLVEEDSLHFMQNVWSVLADHMDYNINFHDYNEVWFPYATWMAELIEKGVLLRKGDNVYLWIWPKGIKSTCNEHPIRYYSFVR